jgi:hypothetical protein
VRVGDPVVGLRRRYSPRKPGGRLPTLRLPTRFGVQFQLFWCYYAQRRAGRPRSSPRREAANLCGITRSNTSLPNASKRLKPSRLYGVKKHTFMTTESINIAIGSFILV